MPERLCLSSILSPYSPLKRGCEEIVFISYKGVTLLKLPCESGFLRPMRVERQTEYSPWGQLEGGKKELPKNWECEEEMASQGY